MKKYIEIPLEVIENLIEGKRVEGALRRDQWTGKITFKAYKRRQSQRQRDRLVKKLPWGWVKESAMRIKLFGSFPKDEGKAAVMGLMEEHTRDAKNALIEQELIEFC